MSDDETTAVDTSHQDWEQLFPDSGAAPTVQILLGDQFDQEAVTQLIGNRYETVRGEGVQPADLYVVDDHSIADYDEGLRTRKQASGKVFCPVVLVRRKAAPTDTTLEEHPDLADEILTAPLDEVVVFRSFENLLARRADTKALVRRTAELERREQELERYEAYIQKSTDLVTTFDETGHVQYVSPSVTPILGYEQEELIGTDGFELIHPDDRERIWETFLNLVEQPDETMTVEGRLRTADGEWRWLEINGTNQLENPTLGVVVANNRDITERKHQAQKRERTIQRMTDGIMELDGEWRFVTVNEQAEEMLQRDADELKGEGIWDVFPDAAGTTFQEIYSEVMESREPDSFEAYYTGLGAWFEVHVYPAHNGGISIYFRDITDEKADKKRLEAQRDNLELLNQMVRHDIRNDLQVIQTYAEMLAAELDRNEVRKILESAQSAISLTNEARDLAEVMLDSADSHEPVPLAETLQSEVESVRSTHEGVTIEIDGQIPTVDVLADEMLNSVFQNLLHNGITHNDKDNPEIRVSAQQAGETVEVTIADNGPGIPEDQQARIFEKDEKGSASEGTGIGLYLVRTLVDQYDGQIDIEDNEPTGTRFTVSLKTV